MQTYVNVVLSDAEQHVVNRILGYADYTLPNSTQWRLSTALRNAVQHGTHYGWVDAANGLLVLRAALEPETDPGHWARLLPPGTADDAVTGMAAERARMLADVDDVLAIAVIAVEATTPPPDPDAVDPTVHAHR